MHASIAVLHPQALDIRRAAAPSPRATPKPMNVAALLRTDESRARMREAIAGGATLHVCTQAGELARMVGCCAADALIVEPRDASGARVVQAVRSIRRQYPHVAIAVYCPLDAESARDLVDLIKSGADELVIRGYDDPALWVERRKRAVMWRQAALALLGRVCQFLDEDSRSIITYCLELAPQVPTVGGAADAIGVHRKTLVNRLSAAGLPSPRVLVSWCRLLVAVELIEHSGRSVESIAHAMGFGSGAALRKMCRRYTGLRTPELSALGGPTHAVSLFLEQLGVRTCPATTDAV